MVPARKRDENYVKDREIHCGSDVWSTADLEKKAYRLDAHVELECSNRSLGYGKQCDLLYA